MPEKPEMLDPLALQKLQNLELRARSVVEGALSGLHKSPHHGSSVEFAEHKEYTAGDEIKHIDWKAYGKFDRYYIKTFEEETELRTYLLVDCSASMDYRGGGISKLEYARTLAASLGYLLLRQQDQVAWWRSRKAARVSAAALAGRTPARPSDRARRGDRVGADRSRAGDRLPLEVVQRRSLIVVFSDLLEAQANATRHLLRGLRARKHDVVVFHLLDRDELTLPFEGTTVFESMEDDRKLTADPGDVRQAYLLELEKFVDGYRRGLAEGDVEYHLVDTSRAPAEVLLAFLTGAWRTAGRKR